MSTNKFSGVIPILSTPFDENGLISFDDLKKEIDWSIEVGVTGLGIALGSEIFTLLDSERKEILKCVVQQVNGRVPVVMNSGGEATFLALEYSKEAASLGADALMIKPPQGASGNNLIKYFVEIADSVNLPIFMQDVIESQVPPLVAIKLSKLHKNLNYVKCETFPTIPRVTETNSNNTDNSLIIFGGAGGKFMLQEARRGSVGTMPFASMADFLVEIWNEWQNKDQFAAESKFRKFQTLIDLVGVDPGSAMWLTKDMLVRKGIFSKNNAFPRRSCNKPDEEIFLEFHRILDELNI
jgi:4-hydroxy-tetrahydrodipicolinate synthase